MKKITKTTNMTKFSLILSIIAIILMAICTSTLSFASGQSATNTGMLKVGRKIVSPIPQKASFPEWNDSANPYLGVIVERYQPTTANSNNDADYTVKTVVNGVNQWFIPVTQAVGTNFEFKWDTVATRNAVLGDKTTLDAAGVTNNNLTAGNSKYKFVVYHVFKLASGKTVQSGQKFIYYTIDTIPPVAPTFTVNPAGPAPTNQDVTVTINYPADANLREYKIGSGGTWTVYTVPVVLSSNNVVYARGTDLAGNTSTEATVNINYIDKIPPVAPTFSASPAGPAPTKADVTVTINYPADANVQEYKIGSGGTWTAYTVPVVLSSNNVVYARGRDIAGNTSAEATVAITHIDKTPPEAPIFSASPAGPAPTKADVTVTISYPGDANVREYKIGSGGTWTAYTVPVVLSSNNTVYARATDLAGNASTEAAVTIDYIDKIPPDAPTFSASPEGPAPTNQDVIVTINYPADANVQEYKIGSGGTWTAYIAPVVLTSSNVVYARGKDLAENTSTEATLTINYIDKIPPEADVEYSIEIPTRNNVVATLVPRNGEVVTVDEPLNSFTYTFTQNGEFTFRFRDAAGNTGTALAKVTNIDKEAPIAPEFSVNTTQPTEKVIVTIIYPNDANIKEYRIDAGSWQNYTNSFEITRNGTIYARCADEAGNISTESSLSIQYIEVNGSIEGISLDERKWFKYYLGLGRNGITQCMLVAGRNPDGSLKRDFERSDILDDTNHFRDGIFYVDIYGKIKLY